MNIDNKSILTLGISAVVGYAILNRLMKPKYTAPALHGNPWWDYGPSWTNMRLSPEFRQHERPIVPTRDGTDLAVGRYGGVESDPYYPIDYNSPGYDYYRGYIYPEPPARINALDLQDVDFIGPQETAFATVITDAFDKAVDFIKGV
jgi:hypothetical protein